MLDKILTLINAGYTREEITALLAADNASEAPAPVPVSEAPAPVPVPAPAPVPVSEAGSDMAGITAAIETMGKNIIAALQRAQIGGATAPVPVNPLEQMDAITAQIINPTYNKEA